MQLVDEINPILRSKTDMFDFGDNQINLVDVAPEMFAFMESTDDGIGLAAPQVGLRVRLFVMQIDDRKYVCVNPEILDHGTETETNEEGCLSFPDLYVKVKRVTEITVRYWDENGEEHNEVLTGLASRCFQHELDHLNGVTFDKRVSKLVLNMAKRRRHKSNRKGDLV